MTTGAYVESIPINHKEGYGERLIDCCNIVITSYGYVINLFPIVNEVKPSQKTYKGLMCAILSGLLFTLFAYISLGYLAVRIYGAHNI